MPVQLLIYAAVILSCYGSGYYVAWNHEHKEVVMLQTSIDYANKVASQKLAEVTAKVEEETKKQQETILQLEASHEIAQNTNDSLGAKLAAAQLQYRTAHKSSSCSPMPKNSNTTVSTATHGAGQDVDTTELTTELDRVLQIKAPIADKADEDKHFVLKWLSSLPTDLVQSNTSTEDKND